MPKPIAAVAVTLACALASDVSIGAEAEKWPAATAPAVPEADGYVAIPNAEVPPDKAHVYKAIFDSSQDASDPRQILPALNMLGSELNALVAAGVPAKNARFVMVFHGSAVNGLLKEEPYKAKFAVTNPNLPVLAKLKAMGVELYVCGQFLAMTGQDPNTLSPAVSVASDALIVLMTYQNRGYALLTF